MTFFSEMKNDKERRGIGQNGPLLLLVGITVILLLIIVIAARKNAVKREMESSAAESMSIEESIKESESASVAESVSQSVAESIAEKNRLRLKECSEPEIESLIKSYFDMRLKGDAEGILKLFKRNDTTPDEEYRKKLEAQSSWIRSFDSIEIFLLPGKLENERLGIVKYKINFRRVNTKAPGIMYFYASKDDDGSWRLNENLTKDYRELISDEFEEAGVQAIVDENTIALREALDSDSDLALMYVSFMNGDIYSEYNLDPDREQVVDLFTDPSDSVLLDK